ncbi:TRAP transporter substrate-binding protein DctP [Sphingomonas piscis]|uniref:TRAP transporter substrate-binding protein DctP n=1 Tax=Sphingomonas piscis TaxID=2714943 RepID=UPI001FEADE5F|nr:TRAP transporter substrate-binding protein DctP [Sphingomonas piscis]
MDEIRRAALGRAPAHPPDLVRGLLSSEMSMEELRHGVADIGLITPIYVRGGTHLIRTQSGFYSGVYSVPAQVQVYRCLEAADPQVQTELKGLKVLAVQGGSLPGIVTRDRPIRRLEDLRGLRLRAPSELLTVLDGLGADPVNMPMGEVYSAMAKGVIDGVVAPADTFAALHFAEVAKHFNTLAVPRGAYPARAMGARVWNRLSPEDRRVLEVSTAVWEAALAKEVEAGATRGLDAARKKGVAIVPMAEAEQQRFNRLYLADAERNAAGLSAFGIDGTRAFRTVRASIAGRDDIRCRGAQ